ncbi:predicted protein [Sclerotinia sclerotiorum 1980 UF-70]|uniref:Uncharacterized protein n=1 Tax=Sclerotinia sclerotiorum (strain ATCC 18683 / 1980 / Ss-1) TaxID=665079 RepID=A7EVR6_SCLS1|nr:predicted protein [Sclerotinia sclerotiorum 1980 UF-70]EDN93558.1 predicted protein [Sclerotinia sclerotiorum 1980 UF-70]
MTPQKKIDVHFKISHGKLFGVSTSLCSLNFNMPLHVATSLSEMQKENQHNASIGDLKYRVKAADSS